MSWGSGSWLLVSAAPPTFFFLQGEFVVETRSYGFKDAGGFIDHFGTDAVAGEDCDLQEHGLYCSAGSWCRVQRLKKECYVRRLGAQRGVNPRRRAVHREFLQGARQSCCRTFSFVSVQVFWRENL